MRGIFLNKKLWLGIFAAGLIIFVFLLVSWAYSHGSVEISLPVSSNTDVTYTLINHGSKTATIVQGHGNRQSLRLKKGAYDLIAESSGSSFFTVTAVKGWLGSTTVSAELRPEYGRRFIANNTSNCMNFVRDSIISYGCDGSVEEIKLHIPATKTLPPFAIANSSSSVIGEIEGTLETPSGLQVMISSPGTERTYPDHSMYSLTSKQGRLINPKPLRRFADLDPSKGYRARAYGNGFVIYATDLREVYYYDSFDVNAVAEKVTAYTPTDRSLVAVDTEVTKQNILTLFSRSQDVTEDNHPKSEIVVGNTSTVVRFTLDRTYSSALLCGEHRLCLKGSEGLDIYDIGASEAKFLYRVGSARDVYVFGSRVLLVLNKHVVEFNVESRQGFASYALGDYSLSAITQRGDDYVANIETTDSASFGLLVSGGVENDEIDRKISRLRNNSLIKAVTPYYNQVFISPNVGELVLNKDTGTFEYSRERRASVAKQLPAIVSGAGIDTSKYIIVNTLP